MARKVTVSLKRSDITPESVLISQGLDPDEIVAFEIIFRLEAISMPRGGAFGLETKRYAQDPQGNVFALDGSEFDSLTIQRQAQPPIPPEDVIDPETGEVVVAKGAQRKQIPKWKNYLDQPLPAHQPLTTVRELLQLVHKTGIATLAALLPSWANGQDIDIEAPEE